MDSAQMTTELLSTTTSQVMVVIWGYDKPESAHFDWAFEHLQGTPALVTLFQRLLAGFSEPDWLFCYVHGQRSFLLKEELERLGCQVCRIHASNRISLFEQLSITYPQVATLVAYPEHSLFPDCSFARLLLQEHLEREADATHAPEYPPGFAPEIFKVAAIHRLATLGVPDETKRDPIGLMQIANRFCSEDGQLDELRFRVTAISDDHAGAPTLEALPANALLTHIQAKIAAETVLSSTQVSDNSRGDAEACMFKTELLRVEHERRTYFETRAEKRHASKKQEGGPVRVLFSSLATAVSGAEVCLTLLIQHLPRTSVCAMGCVPFPCALSEALTHMDIPVEIAYADLSNLSPLNVAYYSALLTDHQIDLVHQDSHPVPALMMAAHQCGIPIVHHVRALYGRNAPEVLKFCSAIIAVSKTVARDLLRSDMPKSMIKVIYDGIDTRRFLSLHSHGGGVVVTMVARIAKQKQQDLLISAIPSIIEQVPNAKFRFVGEVLPDEVPYYFTLLRTVADMNVTEFVEFAGFQADIIPTYAETDVLVLCTDAEPLGTAILEAMAAGIPAVAPGYGGPAELLSDGVEGLLYAPGNPAHLSSAITTLLKNEQLRREMGARGRERSQRFDIARHTAEIRDLYSRVLGRSCYTAYEGAESTESSYL
jgi:glycosyltransferase involved in cell wall biosynthesis